MGTLVDISAANLNRALKRIRVHCSAQFTVQTLVMESTAWNMLPLIESEEKNLREHVSEMLITCQCNGCIVRTGNPA